LRDPSDNARVRPDRPLWKEVSMTRPPFARLLVFAATIALAGTIPSLHAAAQLSPTKAAQDAAESWLHLTDAGKYGESWDGTAQLFKGAVTREQWIKAITAARGPLGALKARALRSAKHTKTLPGAPDGDYVVLQYTTSFDKKESAVETITPMREADGHWRVSGYYVR
jgi:hypothetical protein